MIKNLIPFVAIILSFAMTSCLGNNNEENTQSLTVKCYNQIQNENGLNLTSANYVFNFNFGQNKIDITSFDTDICPVSYKISDVTLTWDSNKGYCFSSAAPTITTAQDGALSDLHITDLYGQYTGTTIKMRYTVNGETVVYASPIGDQFLYSTTVTTPENGSSEFVWNDATYEISYDISKMAATLYIKNIKFAEKMPLTITEMVADGLSITPSVYGLKISAEEITPKINDTPYPNYKLSNIDGIVAHNFSGSDFFSKEQLNMTFDCMESNVKVNAYLLQQKN